MPSEPPTIYIYSALALGQARGNLEDDIQDQFEEEIEVAGGGGGQLGWNVDLELLQEDADVQQFAKKLAKFLRKWGVPRDTYLDLYASDWVEGQKPTRLNVFDNPARA